MRSHPEVLYTYTTLGGGTSGAVDVGNIYVRLKPKHERAVDAETFAADVRNEVIRIAGAKIAVFTSDFGGGRKQLLLQIKGDDLAAINEAAEMVRRAGGGGARTRWTSRSRARGRSPSSTSSSTAGSPARWA